MGGAHRAIVVTVALTAVLAAASIALADDPEHPSPEWYEREAENYARNAEEPTWQSTNPAFQQRWLEQSQENFTTFMERRYVEGTWPWESTGNICSTWSMQCAGDPFLYPGVDPFYDDEGEVIELALFERTGALLSGRVWAPRDAAPGDALPGVVIETGSVQAPETLYWWFAQTLVRNGYVVMTYDVRGQGRSDNRAPDGTPGTNLHPAVFVDNLIDAVDLMRSTPDDPYPPNATYADERDTAGLAVEHNPHWELLDRDRIGIVGHSLGATGVSVVQGVEPWPGTLGDTNPVSVAVAWDNLSADGSPGSDTQGVGEVVPRVPTMGQSADYWLVPEPYEEPPDPEEQNDGFHLWREAGVPSVQIHVRGGAHYEWSYLPTFPSTSWRDWGNPMVEHYSLAWIDRWLKRPGEPGHDDADARLLDDERYCERLSFYHLSARDFPDRDGRTHATGDLRADCLAAAGGEDPAADDAPPAEEEAAAAPDDGPSLPATGGTAALVGLLLLGLGAVLGRSRHRS